MNKLTIFPVLLLFFSFGAFASVYSMDSQPSQVVDGIELDRAVALEREAITQTKKSPLKKYLTRCFLIRYR